MIISNRTKALQEYLLSLDVAERVGFLKVDNGEGPAIVFNEWDWGNYDYWNLWFEKGIDIFPVIIDVVVPYEDSQTWFQIRQKIREKIWKFNWRLTADREGTIAFQQFVSPSYDHETNQVVFGGIYLFKGNYDVNDSD